MRSSLAVKTLHRVNNQHLFRSPLRWLSFLLTLFSRYALRFAICIAHAVTRYPVLTEQARHLLGSKGDSPRSNFGTLSRGV